MSGTGKKVGGKSTCNPGDIAKAGPVPSYSKMTGGSSNKLGKSKK